MDLPSLSMGTEPEPTEPSGAAPGDEAKPSGRGCAAVILGVPLLLLGSCGAYIAFAPSEAERQAAERVEYEAETIEWSLDVTPLRTDRYSTSAQLLIRETPDMTVVATTTVWPESNRTPLLHAVVELEDGSTMTCQTPRSYLTGGGEATDVDMACDEGHNYGPMYLTDTQTPQTAVLVDGNAP